MPEPYAEEPIQVQLLRALLETVKEIKLSVTATRNLSRDMIYVPFTGPEIYLLHKAFIDSGGAAHETYKSLLEKIAPRLSNKTTRGFSIESLQKASDKVQYSTKENVKRFLLKMVRNIDSY